MKSICVAPTDGHELCTMDYCGWSGICYRGLKQSHYHIFAVAMLYEMPMFCNGNGNSFVQPGKAIEPQCQFPSLQPVDPLLRKLFHLCWVYVSFKKDQHEWCSVTCYEGNVAKQIWQVGMWTLSGTSFWQLLWLWVTSKQHSICGYIWHSEDFYMGQKLMFISYWTTCASP